MKIIHNFKGMIADNLQGVQIPYNEHTSCIYKSVLDAKKAKANKCR